MKIVPNFLLQPNKRNFYKWIGITLSFVITLILVAFFFCPSQHKSDDLGTFDNPEEAFLATQKALLMVSEQVNFGMESVVYLEEYEKIKKIIFK